jgi:hypothetical protein
MEILHDHSSQNDSFVGCTYLLTQSHVLISLPPVPGTRNRSGLSWQIEGAELIVGAAVGDSVPFPLLPFPFEKICAEDCTIRVK